MTKNTNEQGFISVVYEGKTHEDLHTCLFACFLSQEEPKKVWTLVDLPYGKRAIGTKWVYRNKKDERVARIEAIRLFLAYASFKDFVVYQMDVKSAFLYSKIEEEVYVCQPLGFEDPEFPNRVYKVEKALYGLHQAPRAWYETLSTYLLDNRFQRGQIDKTLFTKRVKSDILLKFQMSSMGKLTFFLGLQVTQKNDGIFISQDKYVDEILKKFGFSTMKTASTPMETSKPLLKDAKAEDVDVHLYRSMISSLMYLTSSRPDIMFAHSLFDLEPYSDSDYTGASLDKKSTTGGCQFIRSRLISWQCKKQTVVANFTTEAEYVAAASCCGQELWIQNQMLDYGYNLMNTKIFIDNESTICIVKNLVFHLKTKHIEIRHHFIRDSNEKKLIQMIKIHTDQNVVDLLTKAFDVGIFQYLIATANNEIQVSDVGLTYYWHKLTTAGQVNAARHTLTTTSPTTDEAINEEHVSVHSNDTLLGGEDRLKLNELMKLCTNLSQRALDLENTKTSQAAEIATLKERVKKLERRNKSKTPRLKRLRKVGRTARIESSEDEGLGAQEDASKQGRKIVDLDADVEVTLVDEAQGKNDDNLMFDTRVFDEHEVEVEKVVSTAEVTTVSATPTVDELTLA
ncbi:putative ribonuclease H-like domain-containing protein [Tanacetum coccineum]